MQQSPGIAVTIYAQGRIVSTHVASDQNRLAAIEASLERTVESERAAIRKLIGSAAEPGGLAVEAHRADGNLFQHPVRIQGRVTSYEGTMTIYPVEVCSG